MHEEPQMNADKRRWIFCCALISAFICVHLRLQSVFGDDKPAVVIVTGAPGSAEYGKDFDTWSQRWADAGKRADASLVRIGSESEDQKQRLQSILSKETTATSELWLILIGHGTFDGHDAKFNLAGDDISAGELNKLLEPMHRPI